MYFIDYVDRIIKGYYRDNKYYQDYLVRESKIASQNHIGHKEFFGRSVDIIDEYIAELIDYENQNNLKRNTAIKSFYYLESKSNDSLMHGSVNIEILEKIKILVTNVRDEINFGTKNNDNFTELKPDVNKQLHNHIFLDNYFEFFEILMEEFDVNEKSRADIRFIYDSLLLKKLITKTTNYSNFREFISSHYELDIGANSNPKATNHRKTIFKNALNSFKLKNKT